MQAVHVRNRCAWLNHSGKSGIFINLVNQYPNIRLWFSGEFETQFQNKSTWAVQFQHLPEQFLEFQNTPGQACAPAYKTRGQYWPFDSTLVQISKCTAFIGYVYDDCVCTAGHYHLSQNYSDSLSLRNNCHFVQVGVIGNCGRDGQHQSRIIRGNNLLTTWDPHFKLHQIVEALSPTIGLLLSSKSDHLHADPTKRSSHKARCWVTALSVIRA